MKTVAWKDIQEEPIMVTISDMFDYDLADTSDTHRDGRLTPRARAMFMESGLRDFEEVLGPKLKKGIVFLNRQVGLLEDKVRGLIFITSSVRGRLSVLRTIEKEIEGSGVTLIFPKESSMTILSWRDIDSTEDPRAIAESTTDAYSYDRYGDDIWTRAAYLFADWGMTPEEIEETLRHKFMRWIADAGVRQGMPTYPMNGITWQAVSAEFEKEKGSIMKEIKRICRDLDRPYNQRAPKKDDTMRTADMTIHIDDPATEEQVLQTILDGIIPVPEEGTNNDSDKGLHPGDTDGDHPLSDILDDEGAGKDDVPVSEHKGTNRADHKESSPFTRQKASVVVYPITKSGNSFSLHDGTVLPQGFQYRFGSQIMHPSTGVIGVQGRLVVEASWTCWDGSGGGYRCRTLGGAINQAEFLQKDDKKNMNPPARIRIESPDGKKYSLNEARALREQTKAKTSAIGDVADPQRSIPKYNRGDTVMYTHKDIDGPHEGMIVAVNPHGYGITGPETGRVYFVPDGSVLGKKEVKKTSMGDVVPCPDCGYPMDGDFKVCKKCGWELGKTASIDEFAAMIAQEEIDGGPWAHRTFAAYTNIGYFCSTCKMDLKDEEAYKSHKRIRHDVRRTVPPGMENPPLPEDTESSSQYYCDTCGVDLDDENMRIAHEQQGHTVQPAHNDDSSDTFPDMPTRRGRYLTFDMLAKMSANTPAMLFDSWLKQNYDKTYKEYTEHSTANEHMPDFQTFALGRFNDSRSGMMPYTMDEIRGDNLSSTSSIDCPFQIDQQVTVKATGRVGIVHAISPATSDGKQDILITYHDSGAGDYDISELQADEMKTAAYLTESTGTVEIPDGVHRGTLTGDNVVLSTGEQFEVTTNAAESTPVIVSVINGKAYVTYQNDRSAATWSLPDTKEKVQQLIKYVKLLPPTVTDEAVKGDLYDILGDDKLFNALEKGNEDGTNVFSRDTIRKMIKRRLRQIIQSDSSSITDPDTLQAIKDFVGIKPTPIPAPVTEYSGVPVESVPVAASKLAWQVVEMPVDSTSFKKLKSLGEGIVLLGTSNPSEWVTGVTELLHEEKITKSPNPDDVWSFVGTLTTSGGRTDLVMIPKEGAFDYARGAMWRLRFGDCSWVSDYLVNYRSQHNASLYIQAWKEIDNMLPKVGDKVAVLHDPAEDQLKEMKDYKEATVEAVTDNAIKVSFGEWWGTFSCPIERFADNFVTEKPITASDQNSSATVGSPEWTNHIIVDAYGKFQKGGVGEPTEEDMVVEIAKAVDPTAFGSSDWNNVYNVAQGYHDQWLEWFKNTSSKTAASLDLQKGELYMKQVTAVYQLQVPSGNGRLYFQRFAAELASSVKHSGIVIGIREFSPDNQSAVVMARIDEKIVVASQTKAFAHRESILARKYMLGRTGEALLKTADDISDRVAPMGWNANQGQGAPSGAGQPQAPQPQLQPPQQQPLYNSDADKGKKFNITVDPTDKSVNVKFLTSEEEDALTTALGQGPQYDKNVVPDLQYHQQGQQGQPNAPAVGQAAPQPEFKDQSTPTSF